MELLQRGQLQYFPGGIDGDIGSANHPEYHHLTDIFPYLHEGSPIRSNERNSGCRLADAELCLTRALPELPAAIANRYIK